MTEEKADRRFLSSQRAPGAPGSAEDLARVSRYALSRLFDAGCAVQGIGEILDSQADALTAEMVRGLGKALRTVADTLNSIHREAWNSLKELPGAGTSSGR